MDLRHTSRRTLLRLAGSMAAAGIAAQLSAAASAAGRVTRRGRFGAYPFPIGVASGDPVNDGFVIWTRVAPKPFDPLAFTEESLEVGWEIAEDPSFRKIAAQGSEIARRALGHSVRAEIRGLEPGRPYWYRFSAAGSDFSPVGRAWTAPPLNSTPAVFKIAHASCQHYEQGYFNAYDAMAADAPDLVLHLGDYIYESSWGKQVRRHDGPEPLTLDEYRARHALYKMDESLQAAHAMCPWLFTWDDHEVDNDYASADAEDFMPRDQFLARRAAAYQAYFEHMPLRHTAVPRAAEMRLYQRSQFGSLIELSIMDSRQYRSDHACGTSERGGGQVVPNTCKDLEDPARTILGADQERWLSGGFRRSSATWNAIGSAQTFSRLKQFTRDGAEGSWTDDWNGYPQARNRILAAMDQAKLANPVILGGDIHSYWVHDVKADYADPASKTLGTEIVGTSISSSGPDFETFSKMLPENPHVKFFDSRRRGYVLNTVTPQSWRADFRVTGDVTVRRSSVSTLASFAVEAGKTGAIRV
jgi:alkaline phosphatase D